MRFDRLGDWLSWQETFHPKKIDLGLARVNGVLEKMHPDYSAQQPFTIMVAGTNGKGSSVAMLESIFVQAGYRVGTYTSPHILQYNERIRINGEPVDDSSICAAFDRIDLARENVSLSFFEFGTLASIDLFVRGRVDVQILEVGLGGRLDAVNIIHAQVALITAIDIDHADLLGDTREAIGFEKAGIFRRQQIAIVGDPDVPQSIVSHAQELGTDLRLIAKDYTFDVALDRWVYRGKDVTLENLAVPALAGEQQFLNAASVLQVLEACHDVLPVSRESIEAGLTQVSLAGRYQLVSMPGKPDVLLDVAHNPQAAEKLANYLRLSYPEKKIHALFTIMHDKDVEKVVDPLRGLISSWHLVPLQYSRAIKVDVLKKKMDDAMIESSVDSYETPAHAFAQVHEKVSAMDEMILVFGSFFLISDYLLWQSQYNQATAS